MVKPCTNVRTTVDEMEAMLKVCEWAGRASHMSQASTDSTEAFIARWGVAAGHSSILRYAHLSVELISDRATLNQFVRHVIGGVHIQESQRYIKYGTDKHPFRFILPVTEREREFMLHGIGRYGIGRNALENAVGMYNAAVMAGMRAEAARKYLPMATASTLRTQFNMEAWRHILRERLCNKNAQVDIRALMMPVYDWLAINFPYLVSDLKPCLDGIENWKEVVGYEHAT